MLTRLQVKGFKSLVDADVRFGPFTCVVGANGSGKSNLFDAIRFLSALASHTLANAAAIACKQHGGRTDVRQLFHRAGNNRSNRMSFVADMIVPRSAIDDLGQKAEATTTFLRYSLELGCRKSGDGFTPGKLEIIREELTHLRQKDAPKHLLFPHSANIWRRGVLHGQRHARHFISTEGNGANSIIRQHQDGGGGRPMPTSARNLPRTVLSASNAAKNPTAMVARREMEAWRALRLEPSALRQADDFTAPAYIGSDGSHLPATLHRLSRSAPGRTYAQIANQLSELVDGVRAIDIDIDDKRELLTLRMKDMDGTLHPARALSGGTLRLLALTILHQDPKTLGTLCLEEPENGIHPARIPVMLNLLADIVVDPMLPPEPGNPLRQVIVNTHSPSVFREAPDDSIIFAKMSEMKDARGRLCKGSVFYCLSDTWRIKAEHSDVMSRGDMLPYFSLSVSRETDEEKFPPRRVVDRDDVQLFLPGATPASA